MANKKISALNPAAPLTGAEILPALQAGENVILTISQILALAGGSGLISKTKVEIDQLIADAALEAGSLYKISGVHTSLYDDGSASGSTIILRALSPTSLETSGNGFFYNPKYNQSLADYGIWNNKSTWLTSAIVGTFNPNELITANNGATGKLFAHIEAKIFIPLTGDWAAATSITGNVSAATANVGSIALKSYAIGDKVIFGGYVWENLTGNLGSSLNIFSLNVDWQIVPFDTVNYNLVLDVINYDYANNIITKRADLSGNVVESTFVNNKKWQSLSFVGNPINVFQWGNPFNSTGAKGISDNKVINSFFECINAIGGIYDNNFSQSSIFRANDIFKSIVRGSLVFGYGEMVGNVLSSSEFTNNTIFGSYDNNPAAKINSNILTSCYIYSNVLTEQSQISSNWLTNGSFIFSNELKVKCQITGNKLSKGTIAYNLLYQVSQINNNTSNFSTTITYNILNDNSQINSNNINMISTGKAWIYKNKLVNVSTINSNTISGGFENVIEQNDLTSVAQINSNTLSGGIYIGRNKLERLCQINSNALTGGGSGGNQSFIYSNVLNYAYINGNTLTSPSGMKSICQNFITGDGNIPVIRYAEIKGVSLTGAGNTLLRSCTIFLSILRNFVASGFQLVNLQLNNVDYDFNSVSQPTSLNDAVVTTSKAEFKFSKVFTGAAGAGAIGSVIIPLYTVPAGYFVESVKVDVGAGLTAGAGSIINLGFTVDGLQSGLDDTSGLVSTLNTALITSVNKATFIKAGALRTLSLEVKDAAITAGTATFFVKFGKL